MAEGEDRDLFGTTRGKVLLLLCRGPRTVNELSDELAVTDNAIRAQLVSLQRTGLIRQLGLRPGTRKPHVEYELTAKARRLFPEVHGPALGALIDVLHERLPGEEAKRLLKEAARRFLETRVGDLQEHDGRARLTELIRKLKGVTRGLVLQQERNRILVRSCSCPLAPLTASHPGICQLLAEVLGELLCANVKEHCDRKDSPQCCFELIRD